MDKVTNSEEAKRFLRQLGLHVDENIVKQVVDVLSRKTDRSLYSLYAGRRDKELPVCGKGTAYKIKSLHEKGVLKAYLDYLSDTLAIGEAKHKQIVEPAHDVPKEPRTEQEPYKETPHTKRMRKLADKLAEKMNLPSLFDRNLWDNLPADFQPGKYCLSIGVVEISEDKQIKANYYDVSASLAAPRLVKGLYDHFRTSELSKFVELVRAEGKLDSWVAAVEQYSEALMTFLKIITDKVKDRADVNLYDEVKPGLTRGFITTVWIDAIQQAGEHPWIDNSWYKPPDNIPNTNLWKQDCGIDRIGIMKNKKTLKTYEIWHKQLRHHYANDPLAREIVIGGQKMSDIAEEIRQRLQEFSDMKCLPGRCELCYPSGEPTREQAQK